MLGKLVTTIYRASRRSMKISYLLWNAASLSEENVIVNAREKMSSAGRSEDA